MKKCVCLILILVIGHGIAFSNVKVLSNFVQLFGDRSVECLTVGSNGKIYGGTGEVFAGTGHSVLFVYDPEEEWNPEEYIGANPRKLFSIYHSTVGMDIFPNINRIITIPADGYDTIVMSVSSTFPAAFPAFLAYYLTCDDDSPNPQVKFLNYPCLNNSFIEDMIYVPDQSDSGDIYLITNNGYLFQYDLNTSTYVYNEHINNVVAGESWFFSMCRGPGDYLYLGTLGGNPRIVSFNMTSRVFTILGSFSEIGLHSGTVAISALESDGINRLYGGTLRNNGTELFFYEIDNSTFTTVGYIESDSQSLWMTDLLFGSDNLLYGSTRALYYGKIFIYDPVLEEITLSITAIESGPDPDEFGYCSEQCITSMVEHPNMNKYMGSKDGRALLALGGQFAVADFVSPASIDFDYTWISSNDLFIKWDTSGDDGNDGDVAYYRMVISTQTIEHIEAFELNSNTYLFKGSVNSTIINSHSRDYRYLTVIAYDDVDNNSEFLYFKTISTYRDFFVFPNPVYPDMQNSMVYFYNIPNAIKSIKVFNISGQKVASLNKNIMLFEDSILDLYCGSLKCDYAEWNLRNSQGHKVASGVYIVIIEDRFGNFSIRKFAVIK